jgi:hypothetical protein
MVNLLSQTYLLTFDTCSLLSPDGELAVSDLVADLQSMLCHPVSVLSVQLLKYDPRLVSRKWCTFIILLFFLSF